MISALKELTVLSEETWVNLIIQSQPKTGIKCKTVLSAVSVVYRSSWAEGLSEEFVEEGGYKLCHEGQKGQRLR